jgi:hypothetical protein
LARYVRNRTLAEIPVGIATLILLMPWLVLDIARRHGGDAVCLAAEGGGSRFRVDLPAA